MPRGKTLKAYAKLPTIYKAISLIKEVVAKEVILKWNPP